MAVVPLLSLYKYKGGKKNNISGWAEFLFFLFFNFSSHLAGVASGATRAALTQHFALQSNAADISAKVQHNGSDC